MSNDGLTLNQLTERNAILVTEVEKLRAEREQLAAENVGLKAGIGEAYDEMEQLDDGYFSTDADGEPMDTLITLVDAQAAIQRLAIDIETPATDRIVAVIKSDAAAPLVSALKVIANSEQHNGDTVVCDFDTLISVAACALRDYYAKQLRAGTDK